MPQADAGNCPFFMTHHAPVGAWASFTMGLPGVGVGFEHEALAIEPLADLLAAVSHGPGRVTALPFVSGVAASDYEGSVAKIDLSKGGFKSRWRFVPATELERRLGFAVDEFVAEGLVLRIFSPRLGLSDSAHGPIGPDAVCPGLLVELEVDNTRSTEPAHGFFGLSWRGPGRLRPMDWSTDGKLCGVGFSDRWALAARAVEGQVFTIRDNAIARHVEAGTPIIHPGANEGGICFRVEPGRNVTLQAAIGFHHAGPATSGIRSNYLFARHFQGVEAVCEHVLTIADSIRARAIQLDEQLRLQCPSLPRRQVLAQASQGYYANASLLESEAGDVLWSVCEGQFAWRNTLDLAADHVPFELWRHPWVTRNIADQFIDRYSYRDQLRFPGDSAASRPGGLSFTHDQGNYTAYAPAGQSGYEMPGMTGCYSYMTTEQLLNGIYVIAGYALASGDSQWAARRLPIARELLDSILARDHWDPSKRDGLPKGETSKVGPNGAEITTYDALDEALKSARGNLYIAVKTWCAQLLLSAILRQGGDAARAAEAEASAHRTALALTRGFDAARGCFPANLFSAGESLLIAGLEPLAVPLYCGLAPELSRDASFLALLRRHAGTCLAPGNCLDSATGHLRLSSGSTNTWPSKVILCHFVADWLLGGKLDESHPGVLDGIRHWLQVSAAERTLADQINSDTSALRGGSYYPRMVTSAVWIAKV